MRVVRVGTLSAVETFETDEAMARGPAQVAALIAAGYVPTADSTPERVRLHRGDAVDVAAPDQIEFIAFTAARGGQAALAAAIADGTVDVSASLPAEVAEEIDGARVTTEPGRSTALLFLNTAQPSLQDVGTRQAIRHSLDPHAIADAAFDRPDLAGASGGDELNRGSSGFRGRLHRESRRTSGERDLARCSGRNVSSRRPLSAR